MYTLTSGSSIIRDADGAHIPADLRNSVYQAYLVWAYGQTEADALHAACSSVLPWHPVGNGVYLAKLLAGLTYVNTPSSYVAPPAPVPTPPTLAIAGGNDGRAMDGSTSGGCRAQQSSGIRVLCARHECHPGEFDDAAGARRDAIADADSDHGAGDGSRCRFDSLISAKW